MMPILLISDDVDGIFGALTIRPPTKRPRDTLTLVSFTHGPPPGSANKRFVVAGGGQGH
jgi:hypothetical protein